MALKKVALRKLEDGIPNQALREIKALQEIEDNQYVSDTDTLITGDLCSEDDLFCISQNAFVIIFMT